MDPALDFVDAGLEVGDLTPELVHAALQNLPPCHLVRHQGLDPSQPLSDRLILLLEPLEAPADLVEVPEHHTAQVAELLLETCEPMTYLDGASVHLDKPLVDFGEAPIDLGELAPEKLDELLVFAVGAGLQHRPWWDVTDALA